MPNGTFIKSSFKRYPYYFKEAMMANLSYPGVYMEEISSGVRPIEAASTSIAAFIGEAEKGEIGKAVKVYNFTEYQNSYGGFLERSMLSHSVYQFFNNGGTQCYIIRVSGENVKTANIKLKDRGGAPAESLTISACSPGVWGNKLVAVVSDGINDPGNEFNLYIYNEDNLNSPLERFENLSMISTAANFVENISSVSKYVDVVINQANTNVDFGTSWASGAPSLPLAAPKTKFRINIDGDGYQEVNLLDGVGGGAGQAANLETIANVGIAIIYVVKKLVKQRASTYQEAFTCTVDTAAGFLKISSGRKSFYASVNVAPALDSTQDASGLLKLGKLNGGIEKFGSAATRPIKNPKPTTPPDPPLTPIQEYNRYSRIGDNNSPSDLVISVLAGSDGDAITNDTVYINALTQLDDKDDVSIIAVPGIGTEAVVGAGMNYCANRPLSDCFFIGDMYDHYDTVDEAVLFRAGITTPNSYGAVYLPWVKMLDPAGKSSEPILVPPSGYVAGLYAKTDSKRGVWKAPAGTEASLGGAVGLAMNFTDVQQGNINLKNVNVIRQFTGSGIVLWGSRTVTSDAEWKYIPVRRMAIMLRVSIYRGIQWAVFEPNDEDLWASLRLNISSFMMTLYRKGAFQGTTPSQAFFVKCDSETTTQADIDLGIVNVLIGFAPLKPAEFVVVKITQKAGQSS